MTTSCDGAFATRRGIADAPAAASDASRPSLPPSDAGIARSIVLRMRSSTSRSERAPNAIAMRRSLPNWFVSTGKARAVHRAEQQRGAARLDDAVGDLGDLEARVDGGLDRRQLAGGAKGAYERAQRFEGHRSKVGRLMAQFIAICRRAYGRLAESEFTPALLDAEAEQARTLYAQGTFRAVWGHTSPAGAVALIEAESLEAAHAALDTLPLKQKDMLDVEVLALGPYRGFGPRS